MIVIPLLYGDHLPDFRWHVVTVGPPVRQIQPQQAQTHAARGPARPLWHRSLIPYPTQVAPIIRASSGFIEIDQPPGIQVPGDGPGSAPMLFDNVITGKPPHVIAESPRTPSGPIHVSTGVQMAKLVKQVIPIYPQLAKNARIHGVVHLMGIIAKDGTIRNLQLIDGHPLLARAALDAVAQWIYRPTLLSGEPVEVICPIDVNFTLGQ